MFKGRSSMQKEVRFATIKDFDFIYDSLQEDLEEQGVLHRFNYSKEAFKQAVFGKKPLGTFLILLMDGKPGGFANYAIDHRNFTANTLGNLYLNDLFVKKSYRRMKGATLLINKLKEIAQQENCGRIEFFTLAENRVAQAFYEKELPSQIINDKLYYMRFELKPNLSVND
jgi:GNAT superfamily N-acetyltransferase